MSTQLAFFDQLAPGPPATADVPASPPPVVAGQLDLFGGAALQLRNVCELLEAGDLTAALQLTHDLKPRFADAAHWQRLLEEWLHRLTGCGDSAEDLARLASDGAALGAVGEGGAALRAALLVGLHGRIATLAERHHHPGALVNGRPAGWHFILAGRVAEARASLEATLAHAEKVGLCRVLLGNLAFREGSSAQARAQYQLGFLADPLGVPVDQIADPALAEVLDDAVELELSVAWVPLVGQARGLFVPTREPSADAAVARFHVLWLESRAGSTAARRELKALAPALFVRLRDEGKL